MDLSPLIAATQTVKPLTISSPAVQAAIAPAVAVQQQAATLTRTQTVQAPQGVGRPESTRDTQSSTSGGRGVDSQTNVNQARSGGGYASGMRGRNVDILV